MSLELYIYEVVGERKEYYLRCERELKDRIRRIVSFALKEFGIEKEKCVDFYTDLNSPMFEFQGSNLSEIYEKIKNRGDLNIRVFRNWNGDIVRISMKPYRRTKAGKELASRWERELLGDFGILIPSDVFFLRLSLFNATPEERKNLGYKLSAKVEKEGDKLFLVQWKGFNPEELSGFRKVRLSVER